ncbi:MAG: TIGR04255 family protein, partial [Candidatus Binatia bacterium]
QYPARRERFAWQSGIQFKPGEAPAVLPPTGRPDGYLFTSSDGRQIVQVRLDGFTFNRLRPYDKWETFRDEARKHWERYRDIAIPEMISRVALRYINRIRIPLPIKDFREYILTTPEIAPKVPQGLAGFFMRLVIPDERSKSVAIVTQTMEDLQEQVLPLIFDIDVFREGVFDVRGPDTWEVLEQLRGYKNEIFFNSITERARELFT